MVVLLLRFQRSILNRAWLNRAKQNRNKNQYNKYVCSSQSVAETRVIRLVYGMQRFSSSRGRTRETQREFVASRIFRRDTRIHQTTYRRVARRMTMLFEPGGREGIGFDHRERLQGRQDLGRKRYLCCVDRLPPFEKRSECEKVAHPRSKLEQANLFLRLRLAALALD